MLETQQSFQHSGPHGLSSSLSNLISTGVSKSRIAELFLTSTAAEGASKRSMLVKTTRPMHLSSWPFVSIECY